MINETKGFADDPFWIVFPLNFPELDEVLTGYCPIIVQVGCGLGLYDRMVLAVYFDVVMARWRVYGSICNMIDCILSLHSYPTNAWYIGNIGYPKKKGFIMFFFGP